MATSRKSGRSKGVRPARLFTIIGLTALVAAWAFVLASLIGFDVGDPPSHAVWPHNDPVHNWCGRLGAAVAYHSLQTMGAGAWAFILMIGLGMLNAVAGRSTRDALVRLVGVAMFAAAISGLQRLLAPQSGPFPDLAGGTLGVVGVAELSERFGALFTFVWLAAMALLGAIVAMDEWVIALFGWMWRWTRSHAVPAAAAAGRATGEFAGEAASLAAKNAANATARAGNGLFASILDVLRRPTKPTIRVNDIDDDETLPVRTPGRKAASGAKRVVPGRRQPDDEGSPTAARPGNTPPSAAELDIADPDLETPAPARPTRRTAAIPTLDAFVDPVDADDDDADAALVDDDAAEIAKPRELDEAALKEKIARLPVIFGQKDMAVATDADLMEVRGGGTGLDESSYQFPPMDLLEEPEENFTERLDAYVREQATALEQSLQQYRIAGDVVGIESGPVVTMYNVRLAPGMKVAQLNAVSSDIARALRAINIRIVPNMAGRDTVGIEVPNAAKEKVRLKELMSRSERFAKMKLPMFFGKDASGEPLIEDLAKMPHMLIAGTTGSGKSVSINTIIMGFLYTRKPSELKLILVDPKMVEMSQFKDIPHLMCPVVTEMGKAAAILEWACGKMDERYELLSEAGCRDIGTYNDTPWEELKSRFNPQSPEEEARIPRKLPYMVFMIDELADLMMTNKEVEGSIIRIAQKARAVGIHLILATQRPQANVVTGLIKSNMPCRVCFKVASGMDSRIVMDQKGGELLLGQGDMLFLSPSNHKVTRAQGTLVDDAEIRNVVRFMRDVASPTFERSLIQIRSGNPDDDRVLESKNNSSASLAAAQEDPLFERSVEIVLETKRGSVSLLQRRLAIGYTRASRLIDLMGIAGIISDHKGSVARDVLITEEDWATMKQLAQAERDKGTLFPAATDALAPVISDLDGAPFPTDEAPADDEDRIDLPPAPAHIAIDLERDE